MMVRFATTCDYAETRDADPCGRRSEEYTQWPACSYCGHHCCPAHMQPGSLDEGDGDRNDLCVCVACHAEGYS